MTPITIRPALSIALAAAVLSTTVLTGCGTAEYEHRYDEQMKELWRLEPFLQLNEGPTSIALETNAKDGISAQLRLPKFCDDDATIYVPTAKDGRSPDPERMLPPFVRSLSGFRVSYEKFIGRTGHDKFPAYFYACAAKSRQSPFNKFVSATESAAKRANNQKDKKKRSLEWESSTCIAPDETKTKWRHASLSLADQTFAKETSDGIEKEKLDGKVEIYIHSDEDRHVMFILRIPNELEESIDLKQLGKSVAATLTWSDDREPGGD